MVLRISCSAGWLLALAITSSPAAAQEVRDLQFFLHRLRTLDHLPELEASHTAMASTWDRSGGNADGTDFKRIEGTRNVLLDVDGPGCIHRIFTGRLRKHVAGTRIQIFLDHQEQPLCNLLVNDFFEDRNGPIPYPLVFHKTYPGVLFPIPFERHCRVQLVNEKAENWGNYWQITYTRYPAGSNVRSLAWPMNETELTELASVCQTWRRAELSPPPAPAQWAVTRDFPLAAGQSERLTLEGPGVIRQMHFRMQPLSEAALRGVQVQMRWEGEERPAVDVALGDLFGWAAATRSPEARFNSLAAGANGDEAYFCMPMPFSKRAEITFENRAKEPIQQLSARLAVENTELPPNWGRFHVSWRKNRAAAPDLPRFGPKNVPVQLVLDETGRGKYVGVLLQVDWPWVHWWGEGDWLIWTDESEWPPSYHGTGSEEYFNAGWCEFDRKAVSGYVTEHPGWAAVYSHHLNDAFQFEKNIRVAEEMMGFGEGDKLIHSEHPQWMSTAYWYAAP